LRNAKKQSLDLSQGLQIGAFQFTSKGLVIEGEHNQDNWNEVGEFLFQMEGSIQWLIGDWLAFGEDVGYGNHESVADALGRSVGTLYNYSSVSKAYEFSRRRENLSFSHHQEAMALKGKSREKILERAEHEGWSRGELRKQIGLLLNAPEEVYDNVHTPFDKTRVPSVTPTSSKLQRWWMGARQGDTTSRKNLRDVIAQYRKWLQELEEGLE
jgi:hypothetical protein